MYKTIISAILVLLIVQVSAQTKTENKPKLDDFVGRYVFPDGSVVPDVTVVVSDNTLNMSSAAGASELTELGVDSFNIVQFSGLAAFKRGDDKKVNAVHIEAQGYVLDGTKQSNGSWSFIYYRQPASKETDKIKK